MMTDDKNIPKIRFKGFTQPWEKRKLGDIFKYEQPQAYIVESTEYDERYKTPVLTAGQSFILGYTDEDFGIKEANSDKPVVIFDDFTTSSHYVDFPFKVKSSAMKLLTLANSKDDAYCAYDVLKNIEYKPVSHERHWISTFAKFDIYIPKSSAEQKQIGRYFTSLDKLIILHQRKYEKLKHIKKSMLEKMFPHEEKNVPEVRFKGFTEPWERRKVQDVADRFDNLRVPVAANLRIRGTTPYYGANGIQDYVDGFTHDGEFVLIAEDGANDLKNYPVKCVNGRIWVNNHAHVLQGKAEIADNSFLAFAISQSDIESLLVGGGRAKLNAETLMGIEFRLPCLHEQYRIGEFLTQLDYLITLHKQKYEKLKQIKKLLLEKMFA